MATPNLAIPHIAAAQNNKEVTANSAFDLFDDSVNGAASFAMADADVTLTAVQLASGGVLTFTGANTADRHVNLPASIGRLFIAKNGTTGVHNVVVQVTGAPGTTVTLAPGSSATLLYSDGTNVIAIAAAGSGSGSLATPTVIALAPGAAGNFQIAHGLGGAPKFMSILITSPSLIWAQSTPYDATNIYLEASDASATGKAYLWT